MLSVAEARARILGSLQPTQAELVGLADAWGRVAAAPVRARLTQPPADVSAMDGYALQAADGVLGAFLQVVARAPAGHPTAVAVGPGQAIRLFTGSVVPGGADCVVAQEDVVAEGGGIILSAAAMPGRHVRPKGQDFTEGTELIAQGTRLGARLVGLAAAANHPWLVVHRRPRIAILATGDEIALPGEPVAPGGIVSSNAHALAALIRSAGAEPMVLPIVRDTQAGIAGAVRTLQGIDMLVTTGGVSVGEHDLVQRGLGAEGFVPDFWKIAMRPGKPLLFGRLGSVPVLGLPGNPVSAFVCAVLFLLPAMARLAGLKEGASLPERMMPLGVGVAANDHREDYLRAAIGAGPDGTEQVVASARQDSSMLHVLASAQGLIRRPPHAPAQPAGTVVPVLRLDTLGL